DQHGTDRKVAAIGVRVARGATMHGFSLNVDNSLDAYHVIVPCGITDAEVTTLSIERQRRGLTPVTISEVLPVLEEHLPTLLAQTAVTV
ncbi:MAG: lipoyl protein ligase domain-containing protein, partial [Actinomycetes bacterium]